MQTIRWRLTVYYGLALTATVAVFGAVIYGPRGRLRTRRSAGALHG